MHSLPPKPNPMLVLDPILGPCVAARSNLAPEPKLLALAVLALTSNPPIKLQLVKTWTKSRLKKSDPGMVALVEHKYHWPRIKKAAELYVGRERSDLITLPPRVARRVLARVLEPISEGDTKYDNIFSGMQRNQKIVAARHHLAVLGLEAIRSAHTGKETTLIGDAWMGVHRGVSIETSSKFRHVVTNAGWVKLVSGGKAGSTPRLKLAQLTGQAKHVAAVHYETIGRLASGEHGLDQLAGFIASAAHPAWTYGGLGFMPWLVAVADAAEVDPATLGVPPKKIASLRKTLTKLYALGETAEEMLDNHALQTDAFYLHQEAVAKRQAAAAARKLEVETARAEKAVAMAERRAAKEAAKAQAKQIKPAPGTPPASSTEPTPEAIAARLITMIGPVPGPQPESAMSAWIASAKPLLEKCTPEQRRGMARFLAPQAEAAGWDSAMTQRFGSIIVA